MGSGSQDPIGSQSYLIGFVCRILIGRGEKELFGLYLEIRRDSDTRVPFFDPQPGFRGISIVSDWISIGFYKISSAPTVGFIDLGS